MTSKKGTLKVFLLTTLTAGFLLGCTTNSSSESSQSASSSSKTETSSHSSVASTSTETSSSTSTEVSSDTSSSSSSSEPEPEPNSLTLNGESTIASLDEFTAKTNKDLDVTLRTTSATALTGGLMELTAGGELWNVNAIPAIAKIDVVASEGGVTILSKVYSGDEFGEYVEGTEANYFKLVAKEQGAKITSVTIEYGDQKVSKYVNTSEKISEDEGTIAINTADSPDRAIWGYDCWDKVALKQQYANLSGDFVLEFDIDHCAFQSNNHQYRMGAILRRSDTPTFCERFSVNNGYWNDVNEVCGIEYRDFYENSGYGLGGNCESETSMIDKYENQVLVSRVGAPQESQGGIPADANVTGHHKITRVIDGDRSIFTWLLKAAGQDNYVNVMTWAVNNTTAGRPYYRATSESIYSNYTGAYTLEFAGEGINGQISGVKVSAPTSPKYSQSHVGDDRLVVDGETINMNWKGLPDMSNWGLSDWATVTLNSDYGAAKRNFVIEFDVEHLNFAFNAQGLRLALSLLRDGQGVLDRFSMNNGYWNDVNENYGIEYRSLQFTGVSAQGDGNGGMNNVDGSVYLSRVGTAQESLGGIPADANVCGHHRITRTVGDNGSVFKWELLPTGQESYVNVMQWAVDHATQTSTDINSIWTGGYTVMFQCAGVDATVSNVRIH